MIICLIINDKCINQGNTRVCSVIYRTRLPDIERISTITFVSVKYFNAQHHIRFKVVSSYTAADFFVLNGAENKVSKS